MTESTIRTDAITHQVFLAIEDGLFLPVGVPVSLEYLSMGDDGVFPSVQSWRSFLRGNFGSDLGGECKPSTIAKWCYGAGEYQGRFVVQVGADRFQPVDAADLELSFTYDANFFKRGTDHPVAVEIFVTATFNTAGV